MAGPYKATEEQQADLKATHGRLYAIESPDGDEVLFRRATKIEHKKFMKDVSDESVRPHALSNLAASAIVFPGPKTPEFGELFERLSAFVTTVGDEILEASGLDKGAHARPL